MTNEELLECIKAEMEGKKIECRFKSGSDWNEKQHECWDTGAYDYRIAPEPMKKEGKWVRREIKKKGPTGSFECAEIDRTIDCLARVPGFGGIEYADPWGNGNRPYVGTSPILFSEHGTLYSSMSSIDTEGLRPGIPVAAWFWKEE